MSAPGRGPRSAPGATPVRPARPRSRRSPLLGRPVLPRRTAAVRGAILLVAVLLASTPVSLLLAGDGWTTLVLLGAVPVLGAGIVLRPLLRRSGVVAGLQVLVVAAEVLLLEARAGLVELGAGPWALVRAQATVLPAAINELASGVAPMTVGLRAGIVIVLLIALVCLCLDLVFVELGWHTPTALVLLAFPLLPVLQLPGGGPWWTIAGPVLATGILLATRTVHADPVSLRGETRPQAGRVPRPVATGLATGLVVLLVAGLTVPLSAVLPSLAEPRVALSMDRINAWRDREGTTPGAVMVDDDVSVRRTLLEQDPVEVLRYRTTAEDPSYLRLRTLTDFDGDTYRARPGTLDPTLESFSDVRTDGRALAGDVEGLETTTLGITGLTGNRLPVPENVRAVSVEGGAVDEGVPSADGLVLRSTDGEVSTGRSALILDGLSYEVTAETNPATAEELRTVDPQDIELPLREGYLSDDAPAVAADLAEEVAADAGAENAFDTALAYQEYFRSGFDYSLRVSTPPGEDPLESFLADRVGYCEQFAATFALMMTSQGYPTRVVVGFTPGTVDGEERVVTSANAHAWPEVWFGPEHGWVRFEPTPAAAGNGVSEPSVTTPDDEPAASAEPTAQTAEPNPSAESSEESAAAEETPQPSTAEEATPSATAEPGQDDGARGVRTVVVVLAVAAALAAAGGGAVVRARRRGAERRDARWAAVKDPNRAVGSAPSDAGRVSDERARRAAGLLAWEEIGAALQRRERQQRWWGWTGRWGRPPRSLVRDPALPPGAALAGLVAQARAVDEPGATVHEEDLRAAARLGAAVSDARYAPEPGDGPAAPDGITAATEAEPSAVVRGLRADADRLIALVRRTR